MQKFMRHFWAITPAFRRLRTVCRLCAGYSALFLFLACETPEPDDRPLAQVGTELITERDYRSFVAGLPEWTKSEAEGSDQVRDYLQSLVDRALILRAARSAAGGAKPRPCKKTWK